MENDNNDTSLSSNIANQYLFATILCGQHLFELQKALIIAHQYVDNFGIMMCALTKLMSKHNNNDDEKMEDEEDMDNDDEDDDFLSHPGRGHSRFGFRFPKVPTIPIDVYQQISQSPHKFHTYARFDKPNFDLLLQELAEFIEKPRNNHHDYPPNINALRRVHACKMSTVYILYFPFII
jgi:hypothetical protein